MSSGYIKLHRKILEWEWFEDDKVFKLFMFILIKANHKPKRWQGVDIDRGQFLTSLDKLAKGTGMSVQAVRTALTKLQSTNEITNKSTKRFRMITVENYSQYQARQDDEQQSEQQTQQQSFNKASTTTKNVKNEKNKTYRPDFVSEKDWNDLLSHRKGHKGKPKNTERALSILAGKIQKTMEIGYTSTEVVEIIIERNWQTIDPTWTDKGKPQDKSGRTWSNGKPAYTVTL